MAEFWLCIWFQLASGQWLSERLGFPGTKEAVLQDRVGDGRQKRGVSLSLVRQRERERERERERARKGNGGKRDTEERKRKRVFMTGRQP